MSKLRLMIQMFEMLNVKRIFQGHIMTLKDYGSEKISVKKTIGILFLFTYSNIVCFGFI